MFTVKDKKRVYRNEHLKNLSVYIFALILIAVAFTFILIMAFQNNFTVIWYLPLILIGLAFLYSIYLAFIVLLAQHKFDNAYLNEDFKTALKVAQTYKKYSVGRYKETMASYEIKALVSLNKTSDAKSLIKEIKSNVINDSITFERVIILLADKNFKSAVEVYSSYKNRNKGVKVNSLVFIQIKALDALILSKENKELMVDLEPYVHFFNFSLINRLYDSSVKVK